MSTFTIGSQDTTVAHGAHGAGSSTPSTGARPGRAWLSLPAEQSAYACSAPYGEWFRRRSRG
jgi:hypothetical protein